MSTAAVIEHDPLEEHLLEALRALQPSAALRSAPPEAEEIWRAQVDSRQADYAARWLQQHGRSFYTIGSAGHESNAAVALALRVDDPALLHYRSGAFYLARASQAEIDGLRDVMLGVVAAAVEPIAGGRHKVFGRKELAVLPMTSTIASQLPRAVGMAIAIDRAARLGVAEPVEDRRGRHVLVRRRLAEPRDRAGRAQHDRSVHVPGPSGAAPARVRGQRSRDQRSVAGGLGRVGAHGAARAALRGRVRERSCRGARRHDGARRLGARAAPAGDPASADGALPQPRGRGRRDGVPDAAGDPGGLRARPDPRNRALARVGRARDRGGARGRLPRRPRRGAGARARGHRAPADDLRGAGHGAARAALPGGRRREGGACPPCRRRAAHARPGDQRRAGGRARAPPERARCSARTSP